MWVCVGSVGDSGEGCGGEEKGGEANMDFPTIAGKRMVVFVSSGITDKSTQCS
jgi:hypothetical protein